MSLVQLYKNPIPITQQTWPEQIKPLVSISCITYNHENYIRDAIEGFLIQKTTFPVEILIHDDASTDNTANIIREYEAKYPQLIKPIYQTENQYSKKDGTIGRIQRGRACGKYYAICEGDDYWTDPLKLQKQVDFLEANEEYGLVHTNIFITNFDNSRTEKFHKSRVINGDVFFELLKGNFISTLSVCFRKELIRDYSNFLGEASRKWKMGDWPLWLYISLQSKIFHLPDYTCTYRITKGSASDYSNFEKHIQFRFSEYEITRFFCNSTNKINFFKKLYLKTRSKLKLYNSIIKSNKISSFSSTSFFFKNKCDKVAVYFLSSFRIKKISKTNQLNMFRN